MSGGGAKRAGSTKKKSGAKERKGAASAPDPIDSRTPASDDWRVKALARIRRVIKEADPDAVEDVKWRKPTNPAGVPVWEHDGIVCSGETYKDKVKLTFAKGAALKDPAGLFNASLDGNARRAIDFREGDKINEPALKALVRAAVALNAAARPKKRSKPG